MDIKLSKKQFKSLLELVHLGNSVVNSREEPDFIDHKYEDTYWSSLVERFAFKAFINKYSAEKIIALIDKYKAATYDHSVDPFEMLKEIPMGR